MATYQQDYGTLGNVASDIFGINRTRIAPAKIDKGAYQYDNAPQRYGQIQGYADAAQNEAAPQQNNVTVGRTSINGAPQGQTRGQQSSLNSFLDQRLRQPEGPLVAPGIADAMFKSATDRGIKQQAAMAASARGAVNPNAALRSAQTQGALTQQQAASDSAITGAQMGLQEHQNNIQNTLATAQMLGGNLATGRSQDIGLATNEAQLQQGSNLAQAQADLSVQGANQGATLQQRQLRDNMIQKMVASGLSLDQAIQQANMQFAQAGVQAEQFADSGNLGTAKDNAGVAGKITGGIINGISAAAGLSDKRAKRKISAKEGKKNLHEFMDNLKPASYSYKKPFDDKKKHTSVMAQDLEKSKIGKDAIKTIGGLKHVDYASMQPAMVAAMANLHHRMKKMEAHK